MTVYCSLSLHFIGHCAMHVGGQVLRGVSQVEPQMITKASHNTVANSEVWRNASLILYNLLFSKEEDCITH